MIILHWNEQQESCYLHLSWTPLMELMVIRRQRTSPSKLKKVLDSNGI